MADPRDFEAVALPHLDAVLRAAVALAGDRDEAEDLVQATYGRALEAFASFRPGTNCRAWLLRILRNLWIDRLRHAKVAGPDVPIDEDLVEAPAAAGPGPARGVADVLERFGDEEIIRALRELPAEQRLAVVLTDVEELTQEEAAEVLGVAVGTVKSRTSRARRALRHRLLDRAREMGWTGRRR